MEQLTRGVLALQARRAAPSLSMPEAELLLAVNEPIPPIIQARCSELISRRDAETLTPAEYEELLRLTEEVEALDAIRVERLAELARLRGRTLLELMADLGLRPVDHG